MDIGCGYYWLWCYEECCLCLDLALNSLTERHWEDAPSSAYSDSCLFLLCMCDFVCMCVYVCVGRWRCLTSLSPIVPAVCLFVPTLGIINAFQRKVL